MTLFRCRFGARQVPIVVGLLCLFPGSSRGEGNETIGPLRQGFLVGNANKVLAAGVGLDNSQPGTITLDVPRGLEIRQVVLYWGLRASGGDDAVILNGTKTVKGELIGTSPEFGGDETRPHAYRADITDLQLIKTGLNQLQVSGLKVTADGFENGAGLVVLGNDGSASALEVRDGCDFAFWRFSAPFKSTLRQRFLVTPSSAARSGELVIMAGDHKSVEGGHMRPSTLEVQVEKTPLQVINDPLRGADGDSWDTLRIPLQIPADSNFVEAQLFSETRTGSKDSPSSFYWLFGSLRVEGEPKALAFSGTVYCDTNGNASRDAGEEGIAGVEVTLNCVHGGQSAKLSTVTNEGGHYRFEGILPGSTCTAIVVPSPALEDKDPTEVCETRTNIQADVNDCDFGYALPPIVGDTVFCDLNGDGAQQEGEPGIEGVRLVIVAPAGGGFPGYSADMISDENGKYLFRIPGVPGGSTVVATVTVDPNTGGARGKQLTTPNPQNTIPLGPGGIDIARDFGLKFPSGQAMVGDTVFLDGDGDGRQDAEDSGIDGVDVRIECPADQQGFPGFVDSTTTRNGGKYLFTVPGIPQGRKVTCRVSIDRNSSGARGKEPTTPTSQDTVPLGPDEKDLDRDFGLKPGPDDARVGDTVFCDLNGNGGQDPGEPGIQGVPVMLSAPAAGGFPGTNQSATTDGNGKYRFTIQDIPFGSMVVARVSIDTGSPAAAGKTLTTANPQDTRPLTGNSEDLDRDFGLKPLAARVGDTVFCDQNGNGILDPGEPGIAGVKVMLSATAVGAFGGFSDSKVTDASGKYLFQIEGIPPATPVIATVEVDPNTGGAAGLSLTTPNPQPSIPLGPGLEDLNRDFGFRCVQLTTKLCMESKSADAGDCVPVRVLLSSTEPVEGFVTAIRHDPVALNLDIITVAGTATEANMAEFTSFEVLMSGGTAAVIMDVEPPFAGNTIPAGTDLPIVVYRYCCPQLPPGSEPVVTPLRFVDGELGTPAKENVVVVGGRSITPSFCEGSVTCLPGPDRPGPYFLCGGPKLGEDNLPVPIRGAAGEIVELCLYYCSPEDNLPGHPQFDHLQGLSMAICYDCRLECIESSFRTPPDTITAVMKAEYVNFQCDNDQDDGDGCEMILAILVDALEPFEGQTFPPTEIPLKVGCVDMKISPSAPCGACLLVEFCNGINGRGRIPIKNLFAAENMSFPARTVNCEICVARTGGFRRGDCNSDSRVNIADGAAIVSALFPVELSLYQPACVDACDANDDGRFDIADTVKILAWLFTEGSPPPAPGPLVPGMDPTSDKLSCDGTACP